LRRRKSRRSRSRLSSHVGNDVVNLISMRRVSL
jgi:hypothetical protein